jgi:HlyD family secretion protein
VVRSGRLEDRFTLTGELTAAKSAVLHAPATPNWSISIKWIAEHSAVVKQGDKVVEFDTSSLSGSLLDKRFALLKAESELVSETARNASTEMDKRIEVERKRVALEKARVDASVPPDLRTRREHQEKQLAVARADDAHKKAVEDLEVHLHTSRYDAQVKHISVAQAARELREIEGTLDRLALRAPRDGLVQISTNFRGGEAQKFQMGDIVHAGTDIVSIPDLSVMQVKARLHDVDEGAIKVGMKVECEFDAKPGHRVGGAITSITQIARTDGRDAVRRVFDVVVKLDKTDPKVMLPGMSARVEVLRRLTKHALLVPRHTVSVVGGKSYALLHDGTQTPVEVDFCALQECALQSGPPEGTALAAPAMASNPGKQDS